MAAFDLVFRRVDRKPWWGYPAKPLGVGHQGPPFEGTKRGDETGLVTSFQSLWTSNGVRYTALCTVRRGLAAGQR